MRSLEQRIEKLEASANPADSLRAIVLHRPTEQATADEVAEYGANLASARKSGAPLILLTLNHRQTFAD